MRGRLAIYEKKGEERFEKGKPGSVGGHDLEMLQGVRGKEEKSV